MEKIFKTINEQIDILKDKNLIIEDEEQNDGFLRFADYFWDGVVADWLVQDRINNVRQQVDEAIRRVEQILRQL